MQPETTPKPVMDVKAPAKSPALLAVHQAPADAPGGSGQASADDAPAPTPVVKKSASPRAAAHKDRSVPIAAILFALFAMAGLSALAVLVYTKS